MTKRDLFTELMDGLKDINEYLKQDLGVKKMPKITTDQIAPMKINKRWSIRYDKNQWILIEIFKGKDRDGNPKTQTKESYYAALYNAATHIINEAGKREDIKDAEMIADAIAKSTKSLKSFFTKLQKTGIEGLPSNRIK